MKIIPENAALNSRNITRRANPDENKATPGSASKPAGCDKITIASSQNAGISDAQFVSQLKRGILSDIQAGAPEYKLDDLRQQIALGEYDVNIPDIIRKMLLDSQEAPHE